MSVEQPAQPAPPVKVTAVEQRGRMLLSQIHAAPKIGVEIGIWKGWLSRYLLMDKSIFLFMVDPWKEASYSETAADDEIARYTQAQHDDAMAEALRNVADFPDRHKVLRMTSLKAAEGFEEGTLDFVFIDGDHSYEGCRSDIEAWWPKVRMNGILSGHDYRKDKDYGVIKAVDEFCEVERIRELRLGDNYTWFVTK